MRRFARTGALFGFALRRDRIFLPAWVSGIVSMAVACAPLFKQVAPSPTDLAGFAEIMQNPALIAVCGPVYAQPYTYGVMYTQAMTVWVLILIAVMNFFLVTRHTRRDEADGRAEMLRSLPVGRDTMLLSTLLVAVLANAAIGVGCAVGLALCGIESMAPGGCALLGAIFGVGGLLFAAVGMLFAQLCASASGALGGSFGVLGVCYALGAAGNISGGLLSYVSPMAIVFKAMPFAGDRAWPVLVLVAEALVLAVVAVWLNAARDLGSGLLPQRSGRAEARPWLGSPLGLAWRLTRASVWTWVAVMFVLGGMYGSVFGDVESFVSDSPIVKEMIGPGDINLSFMTYITAIMANVAAVPVLTCVLKLRSEEKKNRLDPVYATAVSKLSQFVAYLGIGLCVSVVVQLALSAGLWTAAQLVMADPLSLSDTLLAGMVKLPGIWLLAGSAAALTGLLPRWTPIVWLYFGVSAFTVYIGRMANLPTAFVNLTAFGALPDYPVGSFEALPVAAVVAASVVLLVVGVATYANREISYR